MDPDKAHLLIKYQENLKNLLAVSESYKSRDNITERINKVNDEIEKELIDSQ